jgi:hypothetical protein
MQTNEWIARCSARLHAQWPKLHRDQRNKVALDLWSDPQWRHCEPEAAVVDWLRQVLSVPVGSAQP